MQGQRWASLLPLYVVSLSVLNEFDIVLFRLQGTVRSLDKTAAESLWELAYDELGNAERIVRGRVDLKQSRVLNHLRDDLKRPRTPNGTSFGARCVSEVLKELNYYELS